MTFEDNLFSDTLKHELLQLKMAKVSLGVHKKASNMAVRGDIGMNPPNIEIYVRIVILSSFIRTGGTGK